MAHVAVFDRDLEVWEDTSTLTRYLVPVGRALFAALFVLMGLKHFAQPTIAYAASQGVPLASLAVPAAGILAIVGGLSVALGFHARLGAWLLLLFLVPVTLSMHSFWTIMDPARRQLEQIMFLKNLALIGGALLVAHFGAGPVSVDARRSARVAGSRAQG